MSLWSLQRVLQFHMPPLVSNHFKLTHNKAEVENSWGARNSLRLKELNACNGAGRVLKLRGRWMVHEPGRMLIVIQTRYSISFVSKTIRVFSDEKWQRQRGIRNQFIHTLYFTRACACIHRLSGRILAESSCTNSFFLTLCRNQSAKPIALTADIWAADAECAGLSTI